MGLSGPYVPESEEEAELMEDLNTATRRAYRRGLSKREISRLCAFFATATLDPASETEPDRERESLAGQMQEDERECPVCGESVEDADPDVSMAMGQPVRITHDDKTCEYEPRDGDDIPAWVRQA